MNKWSVLDSGDVMDCMKLQVWPCLKHNYWKYCETCRRGSILGSPTEKNFLADPWFIHEENTRKMREQAENEREAERRKGKAWKAVHPVFSSICECDGEEWAEFSLWHLRRKTRRKSRQGAAVIARRHRRCALASPHISLGTPIYRFFFLPPPHDSPNLKTFLATFCVAIIWTWYTLFPRDTQQLGKCGNAAASSWFYGDHKENIRVCC